MHIRRLHRFLFHSLVVLICAGWLPEGSFKVDAACFPPPSQMAAFWPAEGNAADMVSTNFGTLSNVAFAAGKAGQAFVFNGSNAVVTVPHSPALQFTSEMTIEFWVKRQRLDTFDFVVEKGGDWTRNDDNYTASVHNPSYNNCLAFTFAGGWRGAGTVRDTNWHHCAIAARNGDVDPVFYIDGVQQPVTVREGTLRIALAASTRDLHIGAQIDPISGCNYYGNVIVDELSLYARILTAAEIEAIYNAGAEGKCQVPSGPFIFTQPASQLVAVGSGASFAVSASGSPPLAYQWFFKGGALSDATNATFVIAAATSDDAGAYSVEVTNAYGSTVSSNAMLSVQVMSRDFFDSFEPGITPLNWTSFGGMALATNLGGSVSPGNALWFGGSGSRFAATRPLDTSDGGIIRFHLRFANGWIPTWERVDLPGEGVVLESWVQDATNWTEIARFDSLQYDSWQEIALPIPLEAQGPSVRFRWRQLANDGANADHWAIDDVQIQTSPMAPVILAQPRSQTLETGETLVLSVSAAGTVPMAYQWRFNGDALPGQINSSLVINNVQPANDGIYTVLITNSAGEALSSNAVVSVLAFRPCVNPPTGAVAWWSAEGNAGDVVSTNYGNLTNVAFTAGKVGQAFVFNGSNSVVTVPHSPALRFTNELTIEFWVKRQRLDFLDFIVEKGGDWTRPDDNYTASLHYAPYNHCLTFTFAGGWRGAGSVADTNWHHCAITARKGEIDPTFYIDGVQQPVTVRQGGSTINLAPSARELHIGAQVDLVSGLKYYGQAIIDELTLYSRILTPAEVQAIYAASSGGKCATPSAPHITHQPVSQAVMVGADVTLSVGALSTIPVSYQWFFNGMDIPMATNSTLVLTSVQVHQSGTYAVQVANSAGTNFSSGATLSVTYPPALVQVLSAAVKGGEGVTVPVILAANGNENALGFSLGFNPAILRFVSVTPGPGAGGASLLINTNEAGLGRVGLALALPSDTTFAAGTQTVAQLTFLSSVASAATNTSLAFNDLAIERQLADPAGQELPASFVDGTIAIAATEFEGDVSPRPDGDRAMKIADWVLLGRYAARLDYPTNSAEFQRADCAPLSLRGDGEIKVTDWVQAGRYAARLDAATPVGGPANEGSSSGKVGTVRKSNDPRSLRIVGNTLLQGQSASVPIVLSSVGDENALGFSLVFDTNLMVFAGASLGNGCNGATLYVNAAQAGSGRLGFALALGAGSVFPAGDNEVLKISFATKSTGAAACQVLFQDEPVPRDISGSNAQGLPAEYLGGTFYVTPPPSLRIGDTGNGSISLAWPAWATNFTLQATPVLQGTGWTNLVASPGITNNEYRVVLPTAGSGLFYRLTEQ